VRLQVVVQARERQNTAPRQAMVVVLERRVWRLAAWYA
jgi:hypothetical protein